MAETSERTQRVWAARRALHEQHAADLALIAEAARLNPDRLAARAAEEGWTAPIGSGAARSLSQRIGALAERLVGEIEAIERAGAAAGYDKARIDAVTALTRALEKAGEIGEARMERQQDQKKTDADIAAIIASIDQRIERLARRYAQDLVAQLGDAGLVAREAAA